MSNTVKAVCSCKNNSEDDLVVAVENGAFGFISDWNVLTWFGFVFMLIITGLFWIVIVLIWNFDEIINPQYECTQCGEKVHKNQLRV